MFVERATIQGILRTEHQVPDRFGVGFGLDLLDKAGAEGEGKAGQCMRTWFAIGLTPEDDSRRHAFDARHAEEADAETVPHGSGRPSRADPGGHVKCPIEFQHRRAGRDERRRGEHDEERHRA